MSVDANRLRDQTLELVQVESPTGDTAEVARLYAQRLEELGMDVELLDERFPRTPIVIGRLRGDRPGPTIVLNGHLDTVPIPHEPPRLDGETIVRARLGGHEGRPRLRRRGGARRRGGRVVVPRRAGDRRDRAARGAGRAWRGPEYLFGEHGFTADFGVVCELGGPSLPVAHPGARPTR